MLLNDAAQPLALSPLTHPSIAVPLSGLLLKYIRVLHYQVCACIYVLYAMSYDIIISAHIIHNILHLDSECVLGEHAPNRTPKQGNSAKCEVFTNLACVHRCMPSQHKMQLYSK